jgi:hypothetical protein
MRRAGLAVIACLAFAAPALAQSYTAPRTTFGQPDLQGTWGIAHLTPFQRRDDFASLDLSPDEAKKLVDKIRSEHSPVADFDYYLNDIKTLTEVGGKQRSSMIVEPADGKAPYSEKGLALSKAADAFGAYDNPEERPAYERCTAGVGQAPIRSLDVYIPLQIIQMKDAVILMIEDVQPLRIVHLTGSVPPDAIRTLEGYSRGRWEGDTLVVETDHFRADDPFRWTPDKTIVMSAGSKVTERFTRTAENRLLYQFTVEDASLYARPWKAEFTMTGESDQVYEYACHEANYSLVHMLQSGRVKDRWAPAKPAAKSRPNVKPK